MSEAAATHRRGLRVAITGAAGFLGWHLRAYLHSLGCHEVVPIDRACLNDPARLEQAVRDCDAVVHLAGLNRADEEAILRVNPELARTLVSACQRAHSTPHVVFANSTHHLRDTAYGRSKREAASILQDWADGEGARLTNVVFPHLFGEGGRPFYNSGIATFCHQLARDEAPTIIHDGELELVHAQQAAEILLAAVEDGRIGELRVSGEKMLVSQALARLKAMADQYLAEIIPSFQSPIDLDLFNTYRSYLFPQRYPVKPALRSDARGSLFEAVRTLHGGQAFISSTHPGITRGNHYHRRKIERFLVLQGEALIRIRRLFCPDVHEFRVSGQAPAWIDMPTLHTHNIINCGQLELITLFWAHEIFDPLRPDTYPEQVQA